MVGTLPHGRAPAGRGRRPPAYRHARRSCGTPGSRIERKPRCPERGQEIHSVLCAGDDMSAVQRAKLADDLVRRLAAAIRSAQLYATGHPIVVRAISMLVDSLAVMHASSNSIAIGIVGEDLIVGEILIPRAAE